MLPYPFFFEFPPVKTVHFARGKSHKLDLNMLESWSASSCDSLFGWSTFSLVLLPWGVGMIPILSTGELMGFTQPNPWGKRLRPLSDSWLQLAASGKVKLEFRGTKLTWFVSERHWFTHIYLTRDLIFLRDSKNLWCLRIPIKDNQKWRNFESKFRT